MTEINYGAVATEWNRGGARRALAELERQGFVILPIHPTAAMIDAAVNTKGQDGELLSDYMRRSLGNAIAAAKVTA